MENCICQVVITNTKKNWSMVQDTRQRNTWCNRSGMIVPVMNIRPMRMIMLNWNMLMIMCMPT